MPINSGRKGFGGVVAIPRRFAAPCPNFADQIVSSALPFRSQRGFSNLSLSGITKDSAGANLGLCRVLIFRTEDNSFVGETTSDAGGNWSISMNKGGPFFAVSYLAGTPDVAGTTLNTLVPT